MNITVMQRPGRLKYLLEQKGFSKTKSEDLIYKYWITIKNYDIKDAVKFIVENESNNNMSNGLLVTPSNVRELDNYVLYRVWKEATTKRERSLAMKEIKRRQSEGNMVTVHDSNSLDNNRQHELLSNIYYGGALVYTGKDPEIIDTLNKLVSKKLIVKKGDRYTASRRAKTVLESSNYF